jgi:hypothetical protein
MQKRLHARCQAITDHGRHVLAERLGRSASDLID